MSKRSKARMAALKYGYKSGLEKSIAEQIAKEGHKVRYETVKIKYQKPVSTYTPDWILDNGIIVESKGRWLGADRTKHLLIKKQHPELDIRFVFTNSKARLNKTSKTTYGQWCEQKGFKYADKTIPLSWFKEENK